MFRAKSRWKTISRFSARKIVDIPFLDAAVTTQSPSLARMTWPKNEVKSRTRAYIFRDNFQIILSWSPFAREFSHSRYEIFSLFFGRPIWFGGLSLSVKEQ